MYKVTQYKNDMGEQCVSIVRIADSVAIPADPDNTDYKAYLKWLEEGNTPEPADIPPTNP